MVQSKFVVSGRKKVEKPVFVGSSDLDRESCLEAGFVKCERCDFWCLPGDLEFHKGFHMVDCEHGVVWRRSKNNPLVELVSKGRVPLLVERLKMHGVFDDVYEFWLWKGFVCRKRKVV